MPSKSGADVRTGMGCPGVKFSDKLVLSPSRDFKSFFNVLHLFFTLLC